MLDTENITHYNNLDTEMITHYNNTMTKATMNGRNSYLCSGWLRKLKRTVSCLVRHLKILKTLAFEAKPYSINKSNINKKLNVIKNAKRKKSIMCERGKFTLTNYNS